MNSQKMPLKNSLCLLLAATIWGIAFVAQSVGMEYVGPFTFNGVRSLIGAAVLVPVLFILNRSGNKSSAATDSAIPESSSEPSEKAVSPTPYNSRDLWLGGIACGFALFAASSFQQFGIQYTTVGKAGFITACYIVIVPIIGIFLKKKMQSLYMGSRCHGTGRTLSSLHHRRIFHWPRRYSGAGMCFSLFPAHSGD